MRRNAGLEMTRAVDGSVSVTVAVVGRSVTSEISPKKSPVSSVLTFLPLRRTSALPSSRTKNCRPGSSSRIRTLPSARSISSAILATSLSARFERPPKSGTRLRISVFSGALRLRIAPILRRAQVVRPLIEAPPRDLQAAAPPWLRGLTDPGLAELDAKVDLVPGRGLGELELDAARRAVPVLLDDVRPAGGEDDGVEPEVAGWIAADEDAAGAGRLVGEGGRAIRLQDDPCVGILRAVARDCGRRSRGGAAA